MKLAMTGQMRTEQRMKLAPRMIQSMEILQMSTLDLLEKIEQELNNNPVLELAEPEKPAEALEQDVLDDDMGNESLGQGDELAEGFEQLHSLDDSFSDYMYRTAPVKRSSGEDLDRKLEAMKNTAARPQSLHEYLTEQWRLVEADKPVKKAGTMIIDYINKKGYLAVRLEQLYSKDRKDFELKHLKSALKLVQKLDPSGVGARNLKECLLIQLSHSSDDVEFEKELVLNYMKEILGNHLPEISKKTGCSLEKINKALTRLSKLDTSPGLSVSASQNHLISADVIAEQVENRFYVRLADAGMPQLMINDYYAKMASDRDVNDKTRNFLKNNVRSAKWIMDAIEQRKRTLLKVSKAVVKHQADYFDKGKLYLKPLPMSKIADEVGIHLATVSRAVSDKYIQCSWGVVPLREFFSGGLKDDTGQWLSWKAVQVKLQKIIDSEDKTKPLSDDQIKEKLAEAGIKNIARRTVAKYRKLLNIPAARFRKKY